MGVGADTCAQGKKAQPVTAPPGKGSAAGFLCNTAVMAAQDALRFAVKNGKAEDLEELVRRGANVRALGKPADTRFVASVLCLWH